MADMLLAYTREDYSDARILFLEYVEWLGIDLSFQKFDEELQQLEVMYTKPHGGIILCRTGNELAGCVAIRKFSATIAEMKRLYVRPEFRKNKIAGLLITEAEKLASECAYKSINLDTLDSMLPAINLYEKHGYKRTSAYYFNPQPGAVYFSKNI